ncbi:hypothetical protein BGZ83_004962 [Gryganskiella cystojenkinii]|nr:hypothetical protein BGZ83_004962 [Gryganskiella cystojenkinii]
MFFLGIVSDYLYQQWTRSNMFFGHFFPPPSLPPPTTTSAGTEDCVDSTPIYVPIEDCQQLDRDTFYRRYGYPNRPVMLRNSGVESWSAWEQWTLDALLEKVPKYFDFDFFSLLKPEIRPPYRWILIGPQRTGAPWHTDPSGTSAWNTLLSGHKRWALYPPHITPPGHDPTSPTRLTSVSWYLDVYPMLPPEARPLEIVQYPGQTIFVPTGWWHMVLNMDDTVAVTQNFADETNILHVRRSMNEDPSEKSQIRRWEQLRESLSGVRPDLAPAVGLYPEEEVLESLKKESSWLDPFAPDSIRQWERRVRDVMEKTLDLPYDGPVTPIHTGQNVCFLTKQGFVKFFTPMHDGLLSYEAEVRSNELLLKALERADPWIMTSPKILGYGKFLETTPEESTVWAWPYIITETARSDENELVGAEDFIPQDVSGYKSVLSPLLETLEFYHVLALPSSIDDIHSLDFSHRLQNALANHQRWRVFPKQLLAIMSDYLPSDAKMVYDPAQGDRVANLVHGDVSPSNILGILSAEDASSFEPKMLIDLGDASFKTDPLVDYVAVFITVLNCRREKSLTDILKNSWSKLPSSQGGVISESDRDLARRSLWHVLLWPSVGLSMHLARCVANMGEMETWEQVEQAVFGWWDRS